MTGEAIRTPDQRLRVFVSSTLNELEPERDVVRRAIESLRLHPVMFELGARPHPARSVYRAYLDQSHIFIGIYWKQYGWIAPEMEISGLEDEYNLCGERPRLIYVKETGEDRDSRLADLLARIRDDDKVSYKRFATPDQLSELVANDLAVLLSERFEGVVAPGDAVPDPSSATLPRRRWLLAAAAAAAVGILALVGVLALSGGGGDSTDAPRTDELRVSFPATVEIEGTAGDCETTDLVSTGQGSGETSGEIVGSFNVSIRQTLFASEECQSGVVESQGDIITSPNDVLYLENTLPVNPSVGHILSGEPVAAEGEGISLLAGGSGRFRGAVGTGRCEVSGIQAQESSSTTDADCVYQLVLSGEEAPLTGDAVASRDELAEGVVAQAADNLYLHFLFRNNSGQEITGLEIGFVNEDHVRLEITESDKDPLTLDGDYFASLSALGPGAVGRLQLNIRLLDAGGSETFRLQPLFKADTLPDPVRPPVIEIGVVR